MGSFDIFIDNKLNNLNINGKLIEIFFNILFFGINIE